jgi:hypothetical protein
MIRNIWSMQLGFYGWKMSFSLVTHNTKCEDLLFDIPISNMENGPLQLFYWSSNIPV